MDVADTLQSLSLKSYVEIIAKVVIAIRFNVTILDFKNYFFKK